MHRTLRSLISLCFVLVVLLAAAWAPTALAQESATASGPCVPTGTAVTNDELLPNGVVREMVFATDVDSAGFASTAAPGVPELTAVASVLCIAPDTEVEVAIDGAPSTKLIGQFYTTSIVVLSGDLELLLVEQCANANPTGAPACTPTDGVATFRTGGDRATPVALTAGTWTPIDPGSIVVLSDVTVSIRTCERVTRLLTAGVWPKIIPGGACPTGCGRWNPP